MKPNLRNLSLEEIKNLLQDLGEPPFRGEQVYHWITCKSALSFEEMTNLPRTLRKKLEENFCLDLPLVVNSQSDEEGTTKFALLLSDGEIIETVLIPERDHFTLCVSTQVGCAMGCRFCLTAKTGFKRNLEVYEILSQVVIAKKYLKTKQEKLPLRNIVFMGMGEPLANYSNLLKSLRILEDKKGFGFSRKRLTVSTAGLIPEMERLAKDFPTALALSLHAPDDELRQKLMPIARKFSLAELIKALERFPRVKKGRHTIEYTLIKGINDSLREAASLAKLLKGFPVKVNLIPYNPHPDLPFERPDESAVERFQKYLLSEGILTTVRKSKGLKISAACGQLRGKLLKKSYFQTPAIEKPHLGQSPSSLS
ncbi:50S rRNA methyltransferase [Caldimicrobium thiodismutans]|uniref:Probable dual-specificity RNA methyltransferase RlmN n=1 Tax=Caldimicrobium thiodismutans TaxID=1653476 RepID=A0A0U5AVA5_9BACT|nr:23S rRNA (adenine(2503)-C(2))-methyltransferase RlmN [Caldimicrobium thiodismutans]BAU23192.1 50S rRNA methyltransferase [Caldimicrobium thiodismutans]